jgi:glycosyltransferase involved in cell wall biosynthesis
MDIVFVCEAAVVSGGAEKIAIQEAIELRKRGFRVGFIAGNNDADPELVASGVEILLLNTCSFFEETNKTIKIRKLLWNPTVEKQTKAFLAKFSPKDTVVHILTYRLKLSGIVAHLAQMMGFGTIIHCLDYSPICPTSLYYDHRKQENCQRKPMSLSCITCECQNQPWKYKVPKLTSHFWNQSVWKINERAKGLLHLSQLERNTIEAQMKTSSKGYPVLPIGENVPTERVSAEENQNFLFIGRLTEEKGPITFLESANAAGVPAVIIGDGPQGEEARKRFPEAKFTGWIRIDQIIAELQHARGVVVPSVWRETLCLSVIDAMRMGVPCIVSENVGAKQYIENGVTGVRFEDGHLLEAMNRFSDSDLVKSMSLNAWQIFADSPPSIVRHVDELTGIYAKCLELGAK